MENPTFKLEGIIKSKENTEDFEGPLSLILLLLSKNKIEIRDIKIAEILDQYLDYLEEMKRMDLDIASQFITMASHLTYIKAKTLLEDEEEISELEELITSLEELKNRESYKKIKEVTGFLAERSEKGLLYFVKPPEALPEDGEYRYSHIASELKDALLVLLGREREPEVFKQNIIIPSRIVYSVGEKSEEIMMTLRDSRRINVKLLFSACNSRSELVASLMAVLELCKNEDILLESEDGEYVAVYNSTAENSA